MDKLLQLHRRLQPCGGTPIHHISSRNPSSTSLSYGWIQCKSQPPQNYRRQDSMIFSSDIIKILKIVFDCLTLFFEKVYCIDYNYIITINMKIVLILLLVILNLTCTSALDWSSVDKLFTSAINNRTFPGGVLSIATSKSILYQKSYGSFIYNQDIFSSPEVSLDVKYDIASLTKVVATLSAIINLYDQKKIDVNDLVTKYVPEYNNNNKTTTTIKNLLLHNAGLPAEAPDGVRKNKQSVMDFIFHCKIQNPVGSAFVYSDLSFILLAEIAERITKLSIQEYVQKIHLAMGMKNTLYLPDDTMKHFISPTQYNRNRGLIQGVVHDPTCFLFGGVAGHAGIFSSVNDLTRYMRIWLNNGQINGQPRYFSDKTAQMFTTKQTGLQYKNTRALGWDTVPIQSNPPCGHKFSNNSFGHTGFTGTSIWADRQKDLIIVILTNRVHPRSSNNDHIKFRADVSDEIVTILGF